jgi:hypothetical protein
MTRRMFRGALLLVATLGFTAACASPSACDADGVPIDDEPDTQL